MLVATFLLAIALHDDAGCVDPDALARELAARAPMAEVDVAVAAGAKLHAVAVTVTNVTPPVSRVLAVSPRECQELPRAIAVMAAAVFEQRDVLDGPSPILEEPPVPVAAPVGRPKSAATPPLLTIRPHATTGVGLGLGLPLFARVTAGGGARVDYKRIVLRGQGLLRQTVPTPLGSAFAAVTSVTVSPDAGLRLDLLGVELTPRVGGELGGGMAARLDGKRTALVPRAEIHTGVDVALGPAHVGLVLELPLLPVALVDGATRTEEARVWAAARVSVGF
jgi:hypothetical protein